MATPTSGYGQLADVAVLDFASLRQAGKGASVLRAMASACSESGFFYLRNHSIESSLIDRLHACSREFFAQPVRTKQLVALNRRMRGYLPLDYVSYPGDPGEGKSRQEGFWVGHEYPLDPRFPLQGPNLWPEYPRDLKPLMRAYFGAVENISQELLRAFAMVLGVPPGYFMKFFRRPSSRLKLNHYPAARIQPAEPPVGVVPHTDSGAFTLLWQDSRGGLEIQDRNSCWLRAPVVEGTLIVNLGNIMQYWSADMFPAAPHRVMNVSAEDRYSIPFFVNPDADAVIRPAVGEGADFASFAYGEYQADLWRRAFPVAGIP